MKLGSICVNFLEERVVVSGNAERLSSRFQSGTDRMECWKIEKQRDKVRARVGGRSVRVSGL